MDCICVSYDNKFCFKPILWGGTMIRLYMVLGFFFYERLTILICTTAWSLVQHDTRKLQNYLVLYATQTDVLISVWNACQDTLFL